MRGPPWPNVPPLLFWPPHVSPPRFLGTLRSPSLLYHPSNPSVHLHPPLPFDFMLPAPYALFEIRLGTDVIILRGGQYEAQDQLLKGVVVLCLESPLRVGEVSLDLAGTLRHSWAEPKPLVHKTTIFQHKWPSFIGSRDTSTTLPAGNYEWPFEYPLPGNIAETTEGMPEARISYKLKATISRTKLIRDLYTQKPLLVFRAPLRDALEMMQSLPIERTWLDKVDYSVKLSTGVATLGGSVMLDMRLTPLVKGLQLERFSVTLMEFREFHVQTRPLFHSRKHQTERVVSSWDYQVSKDHDWRDMIEGTSQQGWVITKRLNIPNRLCDCVQDVDIHGIQVQHMVRVVIPLRNMDGHMSELCVGIPLFIVISSSIFNGESDIGDHLVCPQILEADATNPPVYGQHILDQLFDVPPYNEDQHGIRPCYGFVVTPTQGGQDYGAQGMPPPGSSNISSGERDELDRLPTYHAALPSASRFCRQLSSITLPDYETAVGSSRQDQVD